MSFCCKPDCEATARHFGPAAAEADRDRYLRKGPDKRARLLRDGLLGTGVTGCSILDVGSGLGLITFELLKHGAETAVLADASPAYLDAARQAAAAAGFGDRVHVVPGDFVETAENIEPADVVVLDRAVCCYPAWRPLLEAAAARCRRVLGITYPRSRPDIRLVLGLENLRRRWSQDAFRAFVHPPAAMDAALREYGLRRISYAGTFFWHVDLYVRESR